MTSKFAEIHNLAQAGVGADLSNDDYISFLEGNSSAAPTGKYTAKPNSAVALQQSVLQKASEAPNTTEITKTFTAHLEGTAQELSIPGAATFQFNKSVDANNSSSKLILIKSVLTHVQNTASFPIAVKLPGQTVNNETITGAPMSKISGDISVQSENSFVIPGAAHILTPMSEVLYQHNTDIDIDMLEKWRNFDTENMGHEIVHTDKARGRIYLTEGSKIAQLLEEASDSGSHKLKTDMLVLENEKGIQKVFHASDVAHALNWIESVKNHEVPFVDLANQTAIFSPVGTSWTGGKKVQSKVSSSSLLFEDELSLGDEFGFQKATTTKGLSKKAAIGAKASAAPDLELTSLADAITGGKINVQFRIQNTYLVCNDQPANMAQEISD